jgi:subtilisin family serine protease
LPSGSGRRVTLVTGDRVHVHTVDGELVPRIEPGAGREGVRFAVRRADDHVYVVPSDAVGLLGAGRLDRRLFDVALLVEFGYDDAHRSDLPLIVQAEEAGARPPDAGVRQAGAEVQPLPAASATGLHQPKARAAEFWTEITEAGRGGAPVRSLAAGIGTVWLDGLRRTSLDASVPQIGAPAAWEAGYTGNGVSVAVLDTGIDATHPDLAGRIGASENFTDEPDTDDQSGHGTHVASTIAGSGAASDGRYRGVAPDASLLNGKVCDGGGFCEESAVLAGMQWATESGARIVNLSLGTEDTPGVDLLEAAIDTLSAQHGTLFVVAAGNFGGDGPLSSPATADAALAVGAVDDDDQIASFSSRGPRVGDAAIKPEITAPGVGIVAARARNGTIGEPVGDRYASLDGTSMATPHTAGAAALAAQRHPDWTGAQFKALLVGAAATTDGVDAFAQGAGRVDAARAVAQDVYAEPSVVSAGRPAWPHNDDEPVTRTVTYRNPGSEPVSLDLAIDSAGPGGEPVPAGTFTLAADDLTVPAGGEARVDVTVDTTRPGPDGHYSAWITATAGQTASDTVVTTPVAVDVEPESYDLTVVSRGRDGNPAAYFDADVFGLDQDLYGYYFDTDGTFTARLPRGEYLLDSYVYSDPEAEQPDIALLVQPLVELDHDQTIELDARRSRSFDIGFDRGDPQPAWVFAGFDRRAGRDWLGSGLHAASLAGVTTGTFGPEVGDDEMVARFQGEWTGGTDTTDAANPSYNLAWFDYGRMMTGLSRQVQEAQLARVRADLRAAGGNDVGWYSSVPYPPEHPALLTSNVATEVPVPGRQMGLYNTDGVLWSQQLHQERYDPNDPDGYPYEQAILDSEPRRYQPGRTYREHWNAAVLGPIVSDGASSSCADRPDLLDRTSERVGDTMDVAVELLGDAAGHTGCSSGRARTSLSRDGDMIGETDRGGSGEFDVPADGGTYRLATDLTRYAGFVLSTRVTAAWTFGSEHVAGEDPEALPLMAVRYAPELDAHNRAPAGGRYEIPFAIDRLGDIGRISEVGVEASFDDGRTWTRLQVGRPRGGRYVASIAHPAGNGFVSLRASVTDDRGNSVEQTIVRAYELKAG